MAIATRPGSKKADLEQRILGSPEVQKLIDELAGKKLEFGRNPLKAAILEQIQHIRYHTLEAFITAGGIESPKIASETGVEHPTIRYDKPAAFFEESKTYFSRFGFHLLCHLKSFFFGKGDLEVSPLKKQGEEDVRPPLRVEYPTGDYQFVEHPVFQYPAFDLFFADAAGYLWSKVKSFFSPVKRFGSRMLKVKKVGYDARRMILAAKARNFSDSVSSSREPEFVRRTNEQAARFVADSFSSVHVTGLDGIISDCLRKGGVIVFRNHQSYTGFVVDKAVYARTGIDNMTFIAGSNIVDMADRKMAAMWREQLTNSGVKLIDRNPPKGRDGLLYFTILGKSLSLDLSEGSNQTIYGDGRDKGRKESSFKTALISFFINHGKFILPVAESFEVIPDDSELAYAGSTKTTRKKPSFDTLLKLKRMPEFGQEPYGEVYLNFGVPVPTSCYGLDNKSMRRCEIEARERATQLVTLSSTYLLAAAVKNSGLTEVSVGMSAYLVGNLLGKIRARNADYASHKDATRVFTAPKLAATDLSYVVSDAADKLASRRALVKNNGTFSVGDTVILDFYAAKGEAPLRAHGILAVKK